MNLTNSTAKQRLTVGIVGAIVLATVFGSTQSRAQQPVIRVKTDETQIRAEPRPPVAIERRTMRREFLVSEIRAPDIGIWFDPAATDSLVIADIAPTGRVAQLGFEEGDRILEVNGVKVTRETDFIKLLFATKAREGRVEVLLVRKNKETVIGVEPALLVEEYVAVRHDPLEQFGVVVDDRHDDRVVVWKVIPRSPAFYGGIKPGDVITRFGDQRIVHYRSFADAVAAARPGVVAVEVNRRERVRPIRVELPREYVGYNEERRRSTTDRRIDGEERRKVEVRVDGEDRGRVEIPSDDDPQPDAAPRRSPASRNGENK